MITSQSAEVPLVNHDPNFPLVLIASEGEWLSRSVESVLGLTGYRVSRVQGGRRTLELARRISPDAIMVDESLGDMPGLDVCRALRDDPLFDHSTPIFLFSSGNAGGRAHSEAYSSGVWEFCTQPLQVETLVLKLATFIRAKRKLGELQSKTLFDSVTGLYSAYGLQQMARQLTARAARNREPLACLALMPDLNTSGEFDTRGQPITGPLDRIIDLCRETSRRSDVVGYLGESRLAILAPATDTAGAAKFVSRLRSQLVDTRTSGPNLTLRAGYSACDDVAAKSVDPADLVRRAEVALQHATASFQDVSFDTIEPN